MKKKPSYYYPEVGKASMLMFKAFQKTLKRKKDHPMVISGIAQIYILLDSFLESMDNL